MRAQSVSLGGRARARDRRRSPPAARTGRARRRAPRRAASAASPRLDQQPVPARAVLVEQQDRLAVGADPGAASREAWISISATRPCTSGSLGRELGQDAAEPQRLLAQRRPHPVVAGAWRSSPR